MIKAVLLDLDNTLIRNPDRAFAMAFLQQLDAFVVSQWQHTDFSRHLVSGIKAQQEPREPADTNYHVMRKAIQQTLDIDDTELRTILNTFYAEIYPRLRDCISPVHDASVLVDDLLASGYAVVIATNPLYPLDAVQQRLRWGGLPDDPGTYALVTHLDNMHFSKPDPAYFAEILARVGIEPDEAVVIGDSLHNDIEPARQLGLHTYHISPDHNHTITALHDQIMRHNWFETLLHRRLQPQMIAPQYRGNIGAMYGFLDTVQPHFWTQQPDPDEWSILQIICHLAESEQTVQRPRLQHILNEDNPFLKAPRSPLGPEMPACDEDGHKAAAAFVHERRITLDFVQALTRDDWQRPARHSIFGPTSLLEMAHFTAQHDRMHLIQLCQTIGHCS